MFSDAISVEDALLQRDTRVLIGMQEFSDTTDSENLKFKNNTKANDYLYYQYRQGWPL